MQRVRKVRHESFYATGIWVDEKLGILVGSVARTVELQIPDFGGILNHV